MFLLISGDPCLDYKTINEWERSTANTFGSACDAFLHPGWYRITSKAGEVMPTECIEYGGRCGTAYTIWLNGSYPNQGEILNATACTSSLNGDCCSLSYEIQIKNCSEFYVYNLVPVMGCPQSYCFGKELPCPKGQTSETGFSPGCKYDPCLDVNYKPLNDWKRSINYNSTQDICDAFLKPGWYRPISEAGFSISTECPIGGYKCGTTYPIWMNGSHPEVNQTKNATACRSSPLDGCCDKVYEIQVKNCGDFFVYNLVETPGCSQAYCFGTEVQCPVGQTSDNGFTPGCQFNPCHSLNYVNISGEYKRSASYVYESGNPIDDSDLKNGWYRFDSYVGNDLVSVQQPMMKCGTRYPVWLNGNLPLVSDKTVNRTCCISGINNTCSSTVNIQIRNCSDFNVYHLSQLQQSSSGYCVGTKTVQEDTTMPLSKRSLSLEEIDPWAIAVIILAMFVCVLLPIGVLGWLRKTARVKATTNKENLPARDDTVEIKNNKL